MNTKVLNATKRAYNEQSRQLTFHAPKTVSVKDAVNIMTAALDIESKNDKGYNNFAPVLLEYLPEDAQILLAREYSVCIYVNTTKKLTQAIANKMMANEFNREKDGPNKGFYRFWWD